MKWFTQEYMASDSPGRTVWNEYQSYIQTIKHHLPGNLSDLCDFSDGWGGHTQLPDGNIRSITVDLEARVAVIDMQASYWHVDNRNSTPFTKEKERNVWLRYFEVIEYRLTNSDLQSSSGVAGIDDNAHDEVEMIAPGIFEHRLLFHGGVEIAVRFRDFKLDYENLG